MALLVALAAYALGAKRSEVTLLGARGAYDRHKGVVILLVAPWLLDVSHYGGGMGSGSLQEMRILFMCTCHRLGS